MVVMSQCNCLFPAPDDDDVLCYICEYNYNPDGNDHCVTNPTDEQAIKCPTDRTCYVQSQFDNGERH